MLDVRLMGRFLVGIDGMAVDDRRWPRRSAKALVKLLALAPAHTLHREQVIEQLWPDLGLDSATNSLDKAIHGARRALEPALARGAQSRYLLTPRNQIILAAPDVLRVDALQFEQAAHLALRQQDAAAARQALGLYGGTLLVDDLYENWTLTRREMLRLLFRTTSFNAAQWFAQQERAAEGVELAQRLLHEDAADDQVHQLLMRLYVALGRPDQALGQFELAQAASKAAGLELGPEIVALEQAIRRAAAVVPQAAGLLAASTGSRFDASWSPNIVPVSFRPGVIRVARWSADGRAVVMSASWDDGSAGLCRQSLDTGEAEPLPWPDGELLACSPAGDLAIALQRQYQHPCLFSGTLAVVPAGQSHGLPVVDAVQCADWHPRSGVDRAGPPARWLAVVREVDGRSRLEFPIGTVRYRSVGWISHLRFSPEGRHLAFIDHLIANDDEGDIVVVDLDEPVGGARRLAAGFLTAQGLAWMGQEVWFTASRKGVSRSLCRVGLHGDEQLMHHMVGSLTVHDGRVPQGLLVTADRQTFGTMARHASDAAERDISWHERTTPRDISADGRTLLIEEEYTPGRHHYAAYLRRIDGSGTRPIADGVPLVMSPDQRSVVLRIPSARSSLALLDLPGKNLRRLDQVGDPPLVYSEFVSYFPDSRRIVFAATDLAHGHRIYCQDLAGGRPVCLLPDDAGMRMPWNRAVSPDGLGIVLKDADDRLCLVPAGGGPGTPLLPLGRGYQLLGWHGNAQELFVCRAGALPLVVYRYHLGSGELREWLQLYPVRAGAVRRVARVRLTADGLSYAYGFSRESSDLYVFEEV